MSNIARDFAATQYASTPSRTKASASGASAMQRLSGRIPNIGIVGAGVSGLRCADILTRAGAKVTIFEARDRIGGRVHQVDNGGYLVDTGSNWIHGTKGNPIMKLAEQVKADILYPEQSQAVWDTQGNRRSEDEAAKLAEVFWASILKAFKYSDENTASIDKQKSLMDWLKEQWAKDYAGKLPFVQDLVEESRMWGQFVGSPIERQSLKFFFLEDGMDGENVFVGSTYRKILEKIAEPAQLRADICLNCQVRHIKYRETDDEDEVGLTLSNGQTHAFDEIVVTCPLGWLKKHAAKTFSPALPLRLTQAISNIGYGALEKLYITFPKPFWLHKNDVSTHPCFSHFHNPTGYHPILINNKIRTNSWNQSTLSLYHLPGKSAQPTLLFYMTGDAGAYTTSQISSLEPHSEEYNSTLRAFAEPYYSLLPNFEFESPDCKPTSFYQTTWQTDPHAGFGSYTTFRIGLEAGDKDIEVMRAAGGLSEQGRGVWLAGEHTAPFVALGTTTGAYWSGEGVARKIAERYALSAPLDEYEQLRSVAGNAAQAANLGNNMNGSAIAVDK